MVHYLYILIFYSIQFYRELDEKSRPFTGFGLHPDLTLMPLNDPYTTVNPVPPLSVLFL